MSLQHFNPNSWGIVDPFMRSFWNDMVRFPSFENEAMKPLSSLMSADLIEREEDYQLHVDMPGVENLEIYTQDNYLTVSADRKIKRESGDDIAHSVERHFGKVRRRFLVPPGADGDKAVANYKDGVLTISMPKKAECEGSKKKVEVTTA